MESRTRFFATIFIFLFTLSLQSGFLFAQEDAPSNASEPGQENESSKEKSSKKKRNQAFADTPEESWQILSWDEETPEAVFKYDVVVEQPLGKTDSYKEVRRLSTKGTEKEVRIYPLLPPGKYRFKVITYDLIERPAAESDWRNFTIYAAHQPVISSIKSNVNGSSTLYLEEMNDGLFFVRGRNLFELKEDEEDLEFTDYLLVPQKTADGAIKPQILKYDERNRGLDVKFNMNLLAPGEYHLRATDSSGLATPDNGNNLIIIKYKKPMDLNISAGYSCPVIAYDDTFDKYMGSRVWPSSANAKAVFIPFKRNWGYLGLGAEATFTHMLYESPAFDIDGDLITANALFVYQKPFLVKQKDDPSKTRHAYTLEIHAGAGEAYFRNFQYHFSSGSDSYQLRSLDPSLVIGSSFQIFITRHLFAEAQVDFLNSFISDMSFGVVIPSINIGYQF